MSIAFVLTQKYKTVSFIVGDEYVKLSSNIHKEDIPLCAFPHIKRTPSSLLARSFLLYSGTIDQ